MSVITTSFDWEAAAAAEELGPGLEPLLGELNRPAALGRRNFPKAKYFPAPIGPQHLAAEEFFWVTSCVLFVARTPPNLLSGAGLKLGPGLRRCFFGF